MADAHLMEEIKLLEYDEKDGLHHESTFARGETRNRSVSFVQAALFCSLFSLLAAIASASLTIHVLKSRGEPSLKTYSPVNHLVEYITPTFNRSRGEDKTPFQGWPTDEIDKTWKDAYLAGMLSTVSPEIAAKLPEETVRFPKEGRENEYIITLDIFHQMHCLDVVRQALYRDRYNKHFYFPNGTVDHCKWVHVDHCLDQVRQALMCSVDVSVVYYKWSEVVQGLRPRVDNLHTCKNYSKVLDWAKENTVEAKDWHPSRRVVSDSSGGFRIETGRNHALDDTTGECNAI